MSEERPCQPGTQPSTKPPIKEHELHAQTCMDTVWDVVAQYSRFLAAHAELLGSLRQ